MTVPRHEFWRRHRGLVWSNTEADDSIHIRAALLRPQFQCLLDIAVEFGLDRLRHEWAELQTDPSCPTEHARSSVERILNNIEKGFALAAAPN